MTSPVPAPTGFDTHAIHAGYRPDQHMGSINIPIYASTTYAQNAPNDLRGGYEYGRVANPTVSSLAATIAALEGGAHGRVFSSGMAATDCVLRAILRPGDHVIIGNDAYGGTYRLIDSVFHPWGIDFTVVDTTDPAQVADAVRDTTRMLWLETPTNPLLNVTDLPAVVAAVRAAEERLGLADAASAAADAAAARQAARSAAHGAEGTTGDASRGVAGAEGATRFGTAHRPGVRIVVDNTFATPYLQRPLDLGADVSLHSTTKYLGGHSDVVGGALVTNDADLDADVDFLLGGVGYTASPFDAYLTARGVKTLGVRMDRHCSNAQAIAEYLDGREEVAQVLYPGLPSHPGHEVAARQMTGFGGMISVRFHSEAAAVAFCTGTTLISLAESLGGVESLVEHPAQMTHVSVEGSQLEVPRDLIRLSIGIENIDDLLADIARACDAAAAAGAVG